MNALRGDVVLVSSPTRTLRTLFIEQLVRRLHIDPWWNWHTRYLEVVVLRHGGSSPLGSTNLQQCWCSPIGRRQGFQTPRSMGSSPFTSTNAKWCNGSRDRLKIYCTKVREGSSPSLATNFNKWECSPIGRRRMLQGHYSVGSSPTIPRNFQFKLSTSNGSCQHCLESNSSYNCK